MAEGNFLSWMRMISLRWRWAPCLAKLAFRCFRWVTRSENAPNPSKSGRLANQLRLVQEVFFYFFFSRNGGKVLSYTDFLFANVIWEYWYMNLVTKSPVLMSTHFYYAEKCKYKCISFRTKLSNGGNEKKSEMLKYNVAWLLFRRRPLQQLGHVITCVNDI